MDWGWVVIIAGAVYILGGVITAYVMKRSLPLDHPKLKHPKFLFNVAYPADLVMYLYKIHKS